MTAKLMEYFNRQPRIISISTADRSGKVDVAAMGSPQMVDERTVVFGARSSRSLANLWENPNAVFMIVEPADDPLAWKGVRVYATVKEIATSGPGFDAFMDQVAKVAGEAVRGLMTAYVTLEITEVRPLIDMGQGWEGSL